ncbi:hypothetical protein CRYUN_Cryun02cG0218000 [Craigia yunnanensis]
MQDGHCKISFSLQHLQLMGSGCLKVLSMPLLILWSSYLAVQKEISKSDKLIQSGMHIIEEKLVRLGIADGVKGKKKTCLDEQDS